MKIRVIDINTDLTIAISEKQPQFVVGVYLSGNETNEDYLNL